MATSPLAGAGLVNPPQEVVCQFLGGRLLEPHHTTALGVHRTQEVVDRPVFTPRVHPLQADQEGAPSIRVEQLLQFAQLFLVLLNLLGRFLVALVVVLEPRIDVLELYFAAGRHSEPIDIFHLDPPDLHIRPPPWERGSLDHRELHGVAAICGVRSSGFLANKGALIGSRIR